MNRLKKVPNYAKFAQLCLATSLSTLLIAEQAHASCTARTFSDSEQKVVDAYIAYYGRSPDYQGLAFWAGELDKQGGSLNGIIEAFGVSEEFDTRFGSLSNESLVNNLYQQLFGRDADSGGLAFYTGELDSGARTLQSISLDILNGAQNEDVLILSNRATVLKHYVRCRGRCDRGWL